MPLSGQQIERAQQAGEPSHVLEPEGFWSRRRRAGFVSQKGFGPIPSAVMT
jgi:hypothetical protein